MMDNQQERSSAANLETAEARLRLAHDPDATVSSEMSMNADSAVVVDRKREAQSFRSEVDGFLPFSRYRTSSVFGRDV
jgi:hypothetical protein